MSTVENSAAVQSQEEPLAAVKPLAPFVAGTGTGISKQNSHLVRCLRALNFQILAI